MKKTWWKESTIYQIYPRSFKDSNGDGIGDLKGLLQKIDYIADLGIDIVWLNPIYDSPNDDNGYDISDYYNIHSEYGTLEDFQKLLAALHERGIKLIMDLVLNHSSDEHKWFEASKQSSDNPYSDYYIWRKGRDGGPPNNWPSIFGGSAWAYVEERDAYYLHLFSKRQPDLNWENPQLRKEMEDILTFWLDMGIDGFRMDAIPLISKSLDFKDAENLDIAWVIENVYSNGPRVHEFMQTMHRNVLSKYDVVTVGEGSGVSKEQALMYVGDDRKEMDLIFQLDHMGIDHGSGGRFDPIPFDLVKLKTLLKDWDIAVGSSGWISPFLDNHDFPRMVSRFANDTNYRVESAKLLAMQILTQRGTPTIYYGSEIGMTNVKYDSMSDYQDIESLNFYKIHLENGGSELEFRKVVETQGRDNSRTPMQWDTSENGGFSTGTPWLGTNPNYTEVNVENDRSQPASIYQFYQKMLAFRKANKTLIYGQFELLLEEHPTLYAYVRHDQEAHFLIILNFSDQPTAIPLNLTDFSIELSNYGTNVDSSAFRPWEAVLYRLQKR